MAPRKTRSKPAQDPVEPQEAVSLRRLEARVEQPPKLFVIPNAALSPESRFVSLFDQPTQSLKRYLYCPSSGLLELSRVGSSSLPQRSCLIVGQIDEQPHSAEHVSDMQQKNGYILEEACAYVATPFDPLFLLTPVINTDTLNAKGKPAMALTLDDHLDSIASTSKHMNHLLQLPKVRDLLAGRLEALCEVQQFGDQETYRPDPALLLKTLLDKANKMTAQAWPPSMEGHVQRQLEVPVLVQSDETGSSAQQTASGLSAADKDKLAADLRLRVALQFIMAMYLSQPLRQHLENVLALNQFHDFKALDTHLEHLQKLRSEAQALRALSDNITRRRPDLDDDEANELREAKRRKKDDDEKKRKEESRGTKELRKVNTSGMKKLSSFFTKKTTSA